VRHLSTLVAHGLPRSEGGGGDAATSCRAHVGSFDGRPEKFLGREAPRRCAGEGSIAERRLLLVTIAVLGAILVIAALVANPNLLGSLETSPNEPRQATPAVELPTWSVGDRWTYNVTVTSTSDDLALSSLPAPDLTGTVTKEVRALADGEYNVSVTANLDGLMMASLYDETVVQITEAGIEGYSRYRASDLATIMDVRTVRLRAEMPTLMGTLSAYLTVWTQTAYHPAWDAWAFPIDETETWPVMTNATVDGRAVLRLEGLDGYLEAGKEFSFAMPLNYSIVSAGLQNITVPAGTFRSMHTFAVLPQIDLELEDDLAMVLALDAGSLPIPNASVDVWFAEDVGNIVRATVTAGLSRSLKVDVVLLEFHDA